MPTLTAAFSGGKWFPAPIIPGTVLVNVGLAMEGELFASAELGFR